MRGSSEGDGRQGGKMFSSVFRSTDIISNKGGLSVILKRSGNVALGWLERSGWRGEYFYLFSKDLLPVRLCSNVGLSRVDCRTSFLKQ